MATTPPNGITLVSDIPAPPSTDWVPWLVGGVALAAAGALAYVSLQRNGMRRNPTITVSLTPEEQAALQRSIEKNQGAMQRAVAKGQYTVGGSLVHPNPVGPYNISQLLWSSYLSDRERHALEKDIKLHGHLRDRHDYDKWQRVVKHAEQRAGVRRNPIQDLGQGYDVVHMTDGRVRYHFLHGIYIEASSSGYMAWQIGEAGAKSTLLGSASSLKEAMKIAEARGESHDEFMARTRSKKKPQRIRYR
jgi:hypothetical protein